MCFAWSQLSTKKFQGFVVVPKPSQGSFYWGWGGGGGWREDPPLKIANELLIPEQDAQITGSDLVPICQYSELNSGVSSTRNYGHQATEVGGWG